MKKWMVKSNLCLDDIQDDRQYNQFIDSRKDQERC